MWPNDRASVVNTDKPYLYFSKDKEITYSLPCAEYEFLMHNYIEITIDLPNTPEKPDSSEPVSIDVAYPIHSWCLFGEWKCKVVGYDGDKVVCMMPQNYAHGRYDGFTAGRIKPYETPEQAAKRKRDEWINKALGHTFSGKVAYEVLCDVYDWLLKTGQLKESENES